MKSSLILASILSAFALAGIVNAQTGSGTMGVTFIVQGSIKLTFVTDAGGMAVTGTATSTASLPFGTVSMCGDTAPANVIKTEDATSFSLSTPFGIWVDLANSASTTYTLTATLGAVDGTNTWSLRAVDISAGAPHALTAAGVFGTAVPYTLKLTVPSSLVPGLISNSINFSVLGG